MRHPIYYLTAFIISIGFALYIFGIAKACIMSIGDSGDVEFNQVLSGAVTSIAAVLSTNLGAVLGISVSNPKSEFRKLSTWNPSSIFVNSDPTTFQTIGCYVYIISLLVAAIVWAYKDFTTDPKDIVPLIPELAKSLLGIIVGVLAISFNPKLKPNNNA